MVIALLLQTVVFAMLFMVTLSMGSKTGLFC